MLKIHVYGVCLLISGFYLIPKFVILDSSKNISKTVCTMKQNNHFHPDFIEVVALLDEYLQEKMSNTLIQVWRRVKNHGEVEHQQSAHTFSKSNSSDANNIIPLTNKDYPQQPSRHPHETAERRYSFAQYELPSRASQSHHQFSKRQLNQQFEDIVLEKLIQLEGDISKLKKSRSRSISRSGSKSRSTRRKNGTMVNSYIKDQTYTPKYMPMGPLVEKLKIKDITNMIQQQENYSISANYQQDNAGRMRNYLSDRRTPAFKKRDDGRYRNSEIFNLHADETEKSFLQSEQYEHQRTLDQLYDQSIRASTISHQPKEQKKHSQCFCKCCDFQDFLIVKAVNAKSIGEGFYRLVPYKFEQISKKPVDSTAKTDRKKFERPPIQRTSQSKSNIISSFKTPNARHSFETNVTQ